MFDLAIIGAGPGGMAAAVAAAKYDLGTVVIDEQQRAGGQIFRQPPASFAGASLKPPREYGWATSLIAEFDADNRVDKRFGWTVVGLLRSDESEGIRVAISHPVLGMRTLQARRVLIATGAYDLPVAFPGWTLPRVMTAGGVQTLVKAQQLAPVGDVVLAGAHPLLLVVADLLVRSGVSVREVAFAQGVPAPSLLLRAMRAVPGHVGMMADTAGILARLMARKVRLSTRTVVTHAQGETGVEEVVLDRVDADWRPLGRPRAVAAQHLVLGYGFSPTTELARQVGCDLRYESPLGGWVVAHDRDHRTSLADVFVAGEPTGVAGADQSRAEGVLAALEIASSLGCSVSRRELKDARRGAVRAGRFSSVVQEVFEPDRRGIAALAAPETTICRCELVTREKVDAMLDASPFVSSVNATKLACRTGMGACQGRYCEATVAGVVAAARNQPVALGGRFSAHLPVRPVPLGELSALGDQVEEDAGAPHR